MERRLVTHSEQPMIDEGRDVRLTPQQAHYIIENIKLDAKTRHLLAEAEESGYIRLTLLQRQELLNALGSRLQHAGFGVQYDLTEDGRMVEGIIDRLTIQQQ
jgi:hypothetical protein